LNAQSQAVGDVIVKQGNFSGGVAVQLDTIPMNGQPGTSITGPPGNFTFSNNLHENNAGPFLRIYMPNGAFGSAAMLDEVQFADLTVGIHQPAVEMTGTTNWNLMNVMRSYLTNNPTVLGFAGSMLCTSNASFGCGGTPNRNINAVQDIVDGNSIATINGASVGAIMATPLAPASCFVSTGGSVPVTTGLQYTIVATDRSPISVVQPLQGFTVPGPPCTVNTTTGNQVVTITRPTLPAGATGWMVWRTSVGGGSGSM